MGFLRVILAGVIFVASVAACSAGGSAPGSASTLPSSSTAPSPAPPSGTPSPSPSPSSSALVLKLFATTDSPPRWATKTLSGPADEGFQIAMNVQDEETHNLWIVTASQLENKVALIDQSGTALFKSGDQRHGTRTYDIPPLAAGTYYFVCTYHLKTMTGTLTVH